MLFSFALALAINLLLFLGWSFRDPATLGQFPPAGPLTRDQVHNAVYILGYLQTALSTTGAWVCMRIWVGGHHVWKVQRIECVRDARVRVCVVRACGGGSGGGVGCCREKGLGKGLGVDVGYCREKGLGVDVGYCREMGFRRGCGLFRGLHGAPLFWGL